MKRFWVLLACATTFAFVTPILHAADAPAPAAQEAGQAATDAAQGAKSAGADVETQKTAAAAAAATAAAAVAAREEARTPDFLEHIVDSVLSLFDIRTSGNTLTHYAISALLLVIALLARRIVTRLLFPSLRKLAARTQTTFDDKLFPALEGPAAALVMVVGIFAALKVMKLSPAADDYIAFASRVAISLALFWAFWRAFGAVLDHLGEIAKTRQLGIAPFMPWLRKTMMVVFAIVGVLTVIQTLGFGENVKTIVAGLGIGSLAFALAAQDSLANIFGAIVVAIDQPFKIGEVVKIGQNVGMIEDIGLRSTRIRLIDKSLMVIPNKMVAAEPITNFSRFTRRRVEQVINLTYSTKPEQMEEMVEEIRRIIKAQPEVDANSVMVFFRDLSASSLDIWIVYEQPDPDFQKHFRVKQRINLEIMRAVEARGLSFAFPTQTLHLAGGGAERLAPARATPPPPPPPTS